MRIIGGEYKGRKLFSQRGLKVRPTADRIREAIFNILRPDVENAVVLDLFSGTGALGMEAISRGAGLCMFIDNHPAALKVIERNILALGIREQTKWIRWDISGNLNCLKEFRRMFTLAFMDPPYCKELIRPAINHLIGSDCMKSKAKIVIEHHSDEKIELENSAMAIYDQRKYGKTMISFLTNTLYED